MKPEYCIFKDLSPDTKANKVRARVIEKSEPKVSPAKTRYQSLELEDSEGKRIRAALFDEEVETYKGVLELGREYDIKNAPLRPVSQQWRKSENDYQMTFGGMTIIQPVDAETGPVIPRFMLIASVPRINNQGERFNVVGVVLYIERVRSVKSKKGTPLDVREVVIRDGSQYQPMILSLWGKLATEGCDKLNTWPTATVIAGFTYMRPSSHKGFSLGLTMSTTIMLNPGGEVEEAARKWSRNNRDQVADLKAKVLDCRNPSDERIIVSIDQVQKKTLDNTLLEEHFWLQATVPELEIEKIVVYIGCNNCGTRCDAPVNTSISCYKCPNLECTVTHRAIHSFFVTDESGTLKLTALGEDCERLLGMTLTEIYNAATSENWDHFAAAAEAMASNPLFFKIGPAYIIRSTGALKWNLKYVSVE